MKVKRMRMIHWLRRSMATIGLAALAGCTPAPAVPSASATPRPALWRVSDADTIIYLFGTIHLLPPNYVWRTPAIDQALVRSDGLIVETMIDESNPQALVAELARVGLRDGLPPILDRVPAGRRAALSAAIAKSGLPPALFDRMETWAAAFSLLGVQFQSLGINGGDGVETTLRKAFAAASKPIGQLETNSQQLSFFDQLSESAQRVLLEGAVDEPAGARAQFDLMLKAWARGDVDAIAKSFNEDMGSSPELLDVLLARRNAQWAGWVQQRLGQPGTVMVAVGAGHLAGDQSLQRELARKGLRTERLQ